MRHPIAALAAGLLLAACTPSRDAGVADSARDSAAATVPPSVPAVDTPAVADPARDTTVAPAATPRRAGAPDTAARPRPKPPAKLPGGFIMVPDSRRDSLRMVPPGGRP